MTLFDILLFAGFILCGVIVAAPIGFALGQRSILQMPRRRRTDFRRNRYGD